MKTCIDKTCEAVLCEECNDLKPSMCGGRGLQFPQDACDVITFEGVEDVETKQGLCVDLTEGVHAYDGDGAEISYTVEPSEIGCCDVGEHELTYTAVGKGNKMLPSFCLGKPMLTTADCGLMTKVVTRVITILQSLPPKIIGAIRTVIPVGTTFDPLEGVSGIDDNGKATEVTYEGRYDDTTGMVDIASVESDIDQNAKHLYVEFEPIQEGSGTPSPDNVRPISGHTEVVTQRTGKNLLEPKFYDGVFYNRTIGQRAVYISGLTDITDRVTQQDNAYSQTAGAWAIPMNMVVDVEKFVGKSVCVSGTFTDLNISNGVRSGWYLTDEDYVIKRVSPSFSDNPPYIKTIAEGEKYLIWYINSAVAGTITLDSPMVELGSTATDYEPYNGETYHTALGQTVYGGVLDVVTGKMTIEWAMREFDGSRDEAWSFREGANRNRVVLPDVDERTGSYNTDILGNYITATDGADPNPQVWKANINALGNLLVGIPSSIGNISKWVEYLSQNPLQIVYKLASPQTISLDKQTIALLQGQNNVWSEDGKVEVVYTKAISGATQFDIEGVYTIYYHTEDECGNETTVKRYLIVGECDTEQAEPVLCKGKMCCATLDCSENYLVVCNGTVCDGRVACSSSEPTICNGKICSAKLACTQTEITPIEV